MILSVRGITVGRKLNTPLDAKGKSSASVRFLKGGYLQDGYGVPEGSSINGSFSFEGEQGYYVEDNRGNQAGKKIFLGTVKNMRRFFENRAKRSGKSVRFIIKPGIGGQHTPFQGIADIFETEKNVKICGEYELGKDYEKFMVDTLKEIGADWDEVAVIPSSKSGSTDETMMVFMEIFYVLLKYQAIKAGIDGERFAGLVLNILREINFINGQEAPGKDLFKIDKKRFGTKSLISLVSKKAGVSNKKIRSIFGKTLGNMFFETTDRVEQSRLSAFIRNSGLDKDLGKDAPGFGAMFDNVGGRWTADLHMMTFLAYYGLDAEAYWKIRKDGICKVREGNHLANNIGKKIIENKITDIALLLPDRFFWFGKSIEQNFNESIWQEGFSNLIAVRQSHWKFQEKYYKSDSKKLIINMTDMVFSEKFFNVVTISVPDFKKLDNQEKVNNLAELITTFYGITVSVGNCLIAKALQKSGYKEDDVDLNNLDNPATKIVQENLFLRQPYVELGKGVLEKRLKMMQDKDVIKPGAIGEELENIKKLARQGRLESNISGLKLPLAITNSGELASVVKNISKFSKINNRKFVPFIYLEGDKFYDLRDCLISTGIEWVMQGTGDQHISYQQVLAQPKKFLPFIISFIPEKCMPGRPAVGFAKGYLNNISPNMARDLFAEASYKALTESRKNQGGLGLFLRIIDSNANIQMCKRLS